MPPPPTSSLDQAPETGGPSDHAAPVVGVLDSGVGGLSVVPALRRALPHAGLVVVADSGHAPYGERGDDWLQARCAALSDFLRAQGAGMMVLACNTATAAAVAPLRERHLGWPIVGIEPGLKPARLLTRSGRIGVMATDATLRSQRWADLLAAHGQGMTVVPQACTGLAWAIEQADEVEMRRLVALHTEPLRRAAVDVVVLGCTHYPFIRGLIQKAMGQDVALVDTAEAVARRAASLLGAAGAHAASLDAPLALGVANTQTSGALQGPPAPVFWTSGNPTALERFAARWLGWTIGARRLPA